MKERIEMEEEAVSSCRKTGKEIKVKPTEGWKTLQKKDMFLQNSSFTQASSNIFSL